MSELNKPEVETTGVTEPEEKVSTEDYKIIVDMLKEMDEQYQTLKDTFANDLRVNHGLRVTVLDAILPYKKGDIDTMPTSEICKFLTTHSLDTRYHGCEDTELLVSTMKTVKDESLLLLSTKAEADEIRNESTDVLKDYFNYLASDKIVASRKQRLEAMKTAKELEMDDHAKEAIQKKIDILEMSLNFNFLLERFDKYGDKEVKSIKEAFFEKVKGQYIIEKFKSKIGHFGYKVDLYHYFFNIEENFLDKKYSPFNNLFLFTYMRMVAYANINDKKDKILVNALTGALANLIYHRFESTENEKYFISMVSQVLDKFAEYTEFFKENNTLYEEHPARKAAEAAHEINRKEALIRKMNEMKITGYDENATADELQKFFNDETDKIIEEQLAEERAKHTDDDGSLVDDIPDAEIVDTDDMIVPTIHKTQAVTIDEVLTTMNWHMSKDGLPFLLTEDNIQLPLSLEELQEMVTNGTLTHDNITDVLDKYEINTLTVE